MHKQLLITKDKVFMVPNSVTCEGQIDDIQVKCKLFLHLVWIWTVIYMIQHI